VLAIYRNSGRAGKAEGAGSSIPAVGGSDQVLRVSIEQEMALLREMQNVRVRH
jgi:hypothetical protein